MFFEFFVSCPITPFTSKADCKCIYLIYIILIHYVPLCRFCQYALSNPLPVFINEASPQISNYMFDMIKFNEKRKRISVTRSSTSYRLYAHIRSRDIDRSAAIVLCFICLFRLSYHRQMRARRHRCLQPCSFYRNSTKPLQSLHPVEA